jgi:hypothetical protein
MAAIDIFAPVLDNEAFTHYDTELQFVDKLIGGVPKDPDTIKKWLTARLDVGDRAVIELAEATAAEMAGDENNRPSTDELMTEVARRAETGNGFKTVNGELVYEARCAKAGLKEAANIAYPGTEFPGKVEHFGKAFRKGLMRAMAERVFVTPLYIGLGVNEPSATEQRVKHITTPQGPRSALNVVDYVDKPRISFVVSVLDDFFPPQGWAALWQVLEQIGLGADRARSDGRFELVTWDRRN